MCKNSCQDNTAELQQLLDKCGDVFFESGEYVISNTLVIHDHTRLTLAQDTVIHLADHACCLMLKNDCCYKNGSNHHIIVEGGTWDGNNIAQTRGKVHTDKPYNMGVVMRFENVFDLTVRDLVIKDPESYAMQFRFVDRFNVENITFDYNMKKLNMDGVHINGPARNGVIRNIKGATNDDLVALNCDDGYDDGEQLICTKGNIENITVDGLFADNGYTAVRLLSCGSTMRNISIKNIFGTYRFYGISFTHHNIFPGERYSFDNIFVENMFCAKPPNGLTVDPEIIDVIDNKYGQGTYERAIMTSPIIWFENGVYCGNVTFSGISRIEEAETQAPTILIDPNVHIDHLVIKNAFQKFVNSPEVPLVVNHSTVDIVW